MNYTLQNTTLLNKIRAVLITASLLCLGIMIQPGDVAAAGSAGKAAVPAAQQTVAVIGTSATQSSVAR